MIFKNRHVGQYDNFTYSLVNISKSGNRSRINLRSKRFQRAKSYFPVSGRARNSAWQTFNILSFLLVVEELWNFQYFFTLVSLLALMSTAILHTFTKKCGSSPVTSIFSKLYSLVIPYSAYPVPSVQISLEHNRKIVARTRVKYVPILVCCCVFCWRF